MKRSPDYRMIPLALMLLALIGCGPEHKYSESASVFRWSVMNVSSQEVVVSGCGRGVFQRANRVQFRAIAGQLVDETVSFEEVWKSSAGEIGTGDEYWCSDQSGVTTTRRASTLWSLRCIAEADANRPASIEATAVLDAMNSTQATRTLTLRVLHSGVLNLTYDPSCTPSWDPGGTTPPPRWAELTILP